MAKWSRLTTKEEYDTAVSRINALIDAERTDDMQNELLLISYLVEEYEEQFHAIPDASPLDVVKFVMEMKDIRQKDLIPILGSKGNVSKILNGSAKIQLDVVYALSTFLGIPGDTLIPKAGTDKEMIAEPAEQDEKSREDVRRESKSLHGGTIQKFPVSSPFTPAKAQRHKIKT